MKFSHRIAIFIVLIGEIQVSLPQDIRDIVDMYKNTAQIQTPNAASLGKFGDIPVGHYNGIPNISIPLYTIQYGDITIPITLSYHAGGMRVPEEASWVGLGWNLQPGGTFTHQLIGDDSEDNLESCFPTVYEENNYFYPMACGDPLLENECNGDDNFCYGGDPYGIDLQPDYYIYNFPGYSGRFTIDQNGEQKFVQKSNLKIEPGDPHDLIDNADQILECWTITTIDGYIYIFNALEVTYTNHYEELKPSKTVYLTDIFSPNNRHVIFCYQKLSDIHSLPSLTEMDNPHCSSPCKEWDLQETKSDPLFLTKIDFSIGSVEFILSDRLDNNEKKLDKIIIKRTLNETETIKEIDLQYDYFEGDPAMGDFLERDPSFVYPLDHRSKRLKLVGLVERSGNKENAPYFFEYYEEHRLPYKTSYARDYWDFFNGQGSNTSLLPDFTRFSSTYCDFVHETYSEPYSNSDRNPDEDYTHIGTLKRITYPLGGYSEFEYEPNDFSNFPFLKNYIPDYVLYSDRSSGDGHVYKEFEIYDDGTDHTVAFTVQRRCGDAYNPCTTSNPDYYVVLEKKDPYGVYQNVPDLDHFDEVENYEIELQTGEYRLKAIAPLVEPESEHYSAIQARVERKENDITLEKMQGCGIRIKKITDFDGRDEKIRVYKYGPDNEHSYGKIMSQPLFAKEVIHTYPSYIVVYSSSVVPISSSASGKSVGYSKVEEWYGENAEYGKKIYAYINEADDYAIWPSQYGTYPPGIATPQHVENGNLLKSEEYKSMGGNNFLPVSITKNEYSINTERVWGAFYDRPALDLYFYWINCADIELSRSEVLTYDETGTDFSKNTLLYNYNRNKLPKEIYITKSDDESILIKNTYPDDYYFPDCEAERQEYEADKQICESNYESCVSSLYSYCKEQKRQCRINNNVFGKYYLYIECEKQFGEFYDESQDNFLGELRWFAFGPWHNECLDFKNDAVNAANYCNNEFDNCFNLDNCKTNLNTCLLALSQEEEDIHTCLIGKLTSAPDESKGIILLRERNILSPVIEQQKWIRKPGETDFKLQSGTLVTYKEFYWDYPRFIVKPWKIYKIETGGLLSNFTDTYINSSDNLVIDIAYNPYATYNMYDRYGNLREYQKTGDVPISIIWDHDATLPMAKVTNAHYDEAVFVGFEDNTAEGWTYLASECSPLQSTNTGNKILAPYSNGYVYTPEVRAGDYQLSVWAVGMPGSYSGATFNVLDYESISGVPALQIDDYEPQYYFLDFSSSQKQRVKLRRGFLKIDELRIHPPDAVMQTFSYDPLKGMISTTDERNITTYYKYDDFYRLNVVLDEERNVLQKIKYNESPQFSVDKYSHFFGKYGGSTSVQIKSIYPWQITFADSWISYSTSTTGEDYDGTLNISVGSYTGSDIREGNITFQVNRDGTLQVFNIGIYQDGKGLHIVNCPTEWRLGDGVFVEWESSGITTLQLELIDLNDPSFNEFIKYVNDDTYNSTTFYVDPAKYPTGDHYALKVSDVDDGNYSETIALDAIFPEYYITITQPTQGEIIDIESGYHVEWIHNLESFNDDYYNITIVENQGPTTCPVGTNMPLTNDIWVLYVPPTCNLVYDVPRYKIRVESYLEEGVYDESDVITLTRPFHDLEVDLQPVPTVIHPSPVEGNMLYWTYGGTISMINLVLHVHPINEYTGNCSVTNTIAREIIPAMYPMPLDVTLGQKKWAFIDSDIDTFIATYKSPDYPGTYTYDDVCYTIEVRKNGSNPLYEDLLDVSNVFYIQP